MSISIDDLKFSQAAFATTIIKQNRANNFNMAIKSSGRDREQSYARL